ncbi:hypothetical protein J6590_010829 [Homalodisca vitripennis]|nr:hypothetical protein J6590_010829 [Homalodisca vitripennis]
MNSKCGFGLTFEVSDIKRDESAARVSCAPAVDINSGCSGNVRRNHAVGKVEGGQRGSPRFSS